MKSLFDRFKASPEEKGKPTAPAPAPTSPPAGSDTAQSGKGRAKGKESPRAESAASPVPVSTLGTDTKSAGTEAPLVETARVADDPPATPAASSVAPQVILHVGDFLPRIRPDLLAPGPYDP